MAKICERHFFKYKLFSFAKNHNLYSIPPEEICQLHSECVLKIWSKNRPVDKIRAKEISKYIEKKGYVDGILKFAYIVTSGLENKYAGLSCYDGQHRLLALKLCKIKSNVLIDILWNVTEERVIEEFKALNQAICVPELYIQPDKNDMFVIEKITNYVKEFVKNYKQFSSASNRPNRPHFNRDFFTDEIFETWKYLVEKCLLQPSDIVILFKILDEINKCPTKEAPDTILLKCQRFNCWLFSNGTSLDKKLIEKFVEKALSEESSIGESSSEEFSSEESSNEESSN